MGQGIRNVRPLAEGAIHEDGNGLPVGAVEVVRLLAALDDRIAQVEARIEALRRTNPISRLIATIATIPGVGPITATAIAASVPDPSIFRSGRDFAAWLGSTPRQNSRGGKERLGGITKRGDISIRHLLFVGARHVIRHPEARAVAGAAWIEALAARRSKTVAAVALANKMARIAWATMTTGELYRSARGLWPEEAGSPSVRDVRGR